LRDALLSRTSESDGWLDGPAEDVEAADASDWVDFFRCLPRKGILLLRFLFTGDSGSARKVGDEGPGSSLSVARELWPALKKSAMSVVRRRWGEAMVKAREE
jgi:hypothetical protein